MGNDWRKGWRYKLKTDRNARRRRLPSVRRRVESFRARRRVGQRCEGPGPHGGRLEVHHVGGLRARAKLRWYCRRCNERAARWGRRA